MSPPQQYGEYDVRGLSHFVIIFSYMASNLILFLHFSADNFHILDHASTGFRLKIKEAIYIQREQSSLNQQLHHVNLKLFF